MSADEGVRDLIDTEAAQYVKNQGDLRLFRQLRMATGEHHAEQIVFDLIGSEELFYDTHERPFGLKQPPELGSECANGPLPAEHIEGAVLRRCHQPRRGVLRHSTEGPDFHRAAEGVLYHVLCQREVMDSEDARQRGDHSPRLAPEKMIARFHHMFKF